MNPILKRGLTVSFILMIGLLAIAPLPRPAHSQNPTPQRIESDDPSITRAGNWTSQATAQASGGTYLYSSGAEADVLTLQFSGPSIEVIFVTGPSLGTLAITVDDIVLRTIITTADQTAYQQSSRIDYLSDEPHTLKVYAQAGGVVGIDAFVVPTSPPDPLSTSSEGEVSGESRATTCAPISATHQVSLRPDGESGNNESVTPSLSSDGRYVAFSSRASDLIMGDDNSVEDIFVYDRQKCTTSIISVSSSGTLGNGHSQLPISSGDGRYIVFQSYADNLVPSDTNGLSDIFVYDHQTATTTRVSVGTGGTQATGGTGSFRPTMSPDGRYIAFESSATNLVANDTNNIWDIFVHDRQTATTTRISVATGGTQVAGGSGSFRASISFDGRFVVFDSTATDLVSGDSNGVQDIFVHDSQTTTTTRISVASDGTQGNQGSIDAAISADGQFIAFESNASNLVPNDTNHAVDVFVFDRLATTITRVSVATNGTQANQVAFRAAISADGRYVVFQSGATNLVPNDTDVGYEIFLRDLQLNLTTRASVASDGEPIQEGHAEYPAISADGRFIAFHSNSYWVVPGDLNGFYDVFVTPVLPQAPTNLTAAALDDGRIQLNWVDNASDETEYHLERSPDGLNNWVEIGIAPANTTTYTNVSLICGTTYHYRVRAYRSGDGIFSAYSNVATATTNTCPPAAPTNLTASTHSQTSIRLNWTDNASDETHFGIERSPNGTTGWSQIGSTVANVASFTDTVYLACGTSFYYRVRAYRSGDGIFSGYSNLANANTAPCRPDALALANPDARLANFIHTLTNPPAGGDYSQFATGLPYGPGGQYIMGDWNGDGLDTIGVYREGAFFFTNDFGTGGTWGGIWFGLGGQPVVGRFDANVNHDCLGVTDSGIWTNGDTYFALYFTCNLTSGPTPPLTFQWLSILLPNSQGFTGAFQFVAGDFNGDGVDSVAVRRGAFIAWTNIPPTTVQSQFNLAQYIGAPGTGDEGKVVAGDWDMNNVDSFGLVYQNGTFYRRNDVEWNTGVYISQTFTPSIGTPFDVASWRPN